MDIQHMKTVKQLNATDMTSSIGRISEWEGLRSRCQEGGVWEGVSPPHWGRGCAPSPEKFCIFASKSHICDAL